MQLSTKLSSVIEVFRDAGIGLINVAVPKTCLTCDTLVAKQGGCCSRCWSELRFISKPLCPVMGSPFSIDMGEGFLCAEAIADPPPFDSLRAAVLYDTLARRLVSSIKYSDRLDLVPSVASWMLHAGHDFLADSDVVLPVPLHRSRLKQRRFNQAAELARFIAQKADIEYRPDLLIRRKPTRQQVGLSEKERARNVQSAFVVRDECKIDLSGRRVVLVDDVYTTGATVKAASRALKRSGVFRINVLVFAKVETMVS